MKQIVRLNVMVPHEKYAHEEIDDIFPRFQLVNELENGNIKCALNGHLDKIVEIEKADIRDIKSIMLVKSQDGEIHEVAGMYDYNGEIRFHTIEEINVLGGEFSSWGYAHNVLRNMESAREAGALYCEVPLVELDWIYTSDCVKKLINEQISEEVAMDMNDWKVVKDHDWVRYTSIIESMSISNPDIRRFQMRNHYGWGSLLTYEGDLSDFNRESYINKAKEIRAQIDNRDQSLFVVKSDENYSVHTKQRQVFVEAKWD